MAKEVDLSKRKKLPPGVDPEMSRRLEAKAIGPNLQPPKKEKRDDPSGLRVAPSASDVAQNVMPLKTGQIVAGDERLTPQERATLIATGWEPGQPIPENLAEIAAQMRANVEAEEYAAGAAMAAGGQMLQVQTVDIEQLDPSERARVKLAMQETAQLHRQPDERPTRPPEFQRAPQQAPQPATQPHTPPASGPDLSSVLGQPAAGQAPAPSQQPQRQRVGPGEPVDMHEQAVPGYQPHPGYKPQVPNPQAYPQNQGQPAHPGPQQAAPEPQGAVEVDLPTAEQRAQQTDQVRQMAQEAPQAAPQPRPRAEPQRRQPPPPEPEEELETFSGPTMTHCPHCEWPLDQEDIPEPPIAEKRSFIQSILGQKPFLKQYELLGGSVTLRFRTLTTKEVDTIYQQVFWEQSQGRLLTIADRNEQINRYRLYLQLLRLEGAGGLLHDLPDGLSEETNPNAEAFWKSDPPPPGQTSLPMIEEYINAEVLKTENITRAVQNTCSRFNRLVAKLEAMVDNSDFWSRTGEQS